MQRSKGYDPVGRGTVLPLDKAPSLESFGVFASFWQCGLQRQEYLSFLISLANWNLMGDGICRLSYFGQKILSDRLIL